MQRIVLIAFVLVVTFSGCTMQHRKTIPTENAFREKVFHSKEYSTMRANHTKISSSVLIILDPKTSCSVKKMVSADISSSFLWITLDDTCPAIEKFLKYLTLCQKTFPGDYTQTEIATAPVGEINSHLLALQQGNHPTLLSQIWFNEVAPECFPSWNIEPAEFATEERLHEIIAENKK